MPGLNKKGPQGMGPMTGGGRGECRQNGAGQEQPIGQMSGRGRRAGGQGRGRSVWCSWGRMMSGFMGRGAGGGSGRGLGRGGLGNQRMNRPGDETSENQKESEKEKDKE